MRVAEGAQVLGGIEAAPGQVAELAGRLAPAPGAQGLAGVLDHRQAMPFGHRHDRRHLRQLAEQVHRHDGLGAGRDGGFHQGARGVEGGGIEVDEDGIRAQA